MRRRAGPPTREELDALYERARATRADARAVRESGVDDHERLKAWLQLARAAKTAAPGPADRGG